MHPLTRRNSSKSNRWEFDMTAIEKTWLKITPCSRIPPREGRCIEIAGRHVALFHTSRGFLAVDNRCPHRGGPLSYGIVNGTTVVCPLHAWAFDLFSGASTNHPESSASLVTYPTRIEDGIIYIELPRAAAPGEIATPPCEHRDRPIRWVQRKASTSARSASGLESGCSPDPGLPGAECTQGA